MRAVLTASLFALLAACGSSEDVASTNDQAAIPASMTSDKEDAGSEAGEETGNGNAGSDEGAEEGSAQGNIATPAAFDWTGTYAISPDMCKASRWRFSRDQVVTDGHTTCQFNDIEEGNGRAVLDLACTSEGNKTDERWTLTQTGKDSFRVRRDLGSQSFTVNLAKCG